MTISHVWVHPSSGLPNHPYISNRHPRWKSPPIKRSAERIATPGASVCSSPREPNTSFPDYFSFLFSKSFSLLVKKENYCTILNTRKKRYFELNMKWFLINIFDKVCICSCTDSPPVQIWKHTMQCYSPCYWFVECVGFRSFNYSFLQLK